MRYGWRDRLLFALPSLVLLGAAIIIVLNR